ncbi:DNA polymerase III subunit epsilon [Pollutimonas subterranea]|uniref:DNA-directed DNA polymerase n=1 Tax=Pollutimonas subterranea TaxID=2045210 RepID=A0A2N4U318_9BURK|nr:3'-5' exonuclease [Pollutimonas subterranea]PLC49414.1 DNA polymerase III subunit epsilon [Pollutimonas subterranea]
MRLRLRIFLVFTALAAGSVVALIAGLYYGFHKQDYADSTDALIIGGFLAGFIIVGMIAWAWMLFDDNIAKPIERLAGNLRTRAHSSVTAPIDPAPARYLGDLATAAQDLAQVLHDTRLSLASSTARETAGLVYEKALLETLLTDISAGVLMCSASHQLVFYNSRAASLIGGLDADATPGLNRSLFDYLHEAPIQAGYARLQSTGDADAASDILCATQATGTALLARMRLLPMPGQGNTPGYMMTLHNNAAFTFESGDQPFISSDPQPLWMIHAGDLANALQAQLNAKGFGLRYNAAHIIVRCNGFQMIALLDALAQHVAMRGSDLSLNIDPEGAGALIRLEWQGPAMPLHEVEQLLSLELATYPTATTIQAVLDNHAASLESSNQPPDRAGLSVSIFEARLAQPRAPAIPQGLVYDFELLFKTPNTELSSTHIEDLTYVVFDTETTGLRPDQGDAIVQIAAVRIVNGRRVQKEVFNTLVNPGRAIPLSSTNVHGITDDMVASAPSMDEVGRKFHQFIKDAVLVAHNAPFDMAFLRLHEQRIGCRFDNPILDTVLLSALVFGQSESHSLDSLSHRLGITITEEARHTAIGDASATADVLLKLIPALKARGLETFGDVLTEVRKQRRLLKDLNE